MELYHKYHVDIKKKKKKSSAKSVYDRAELQKDWLSASAERLARCTELHSLACWEN